MALSDFLGALETLRQSGKPGAAVALTTLEDLIARGQDLASAIGALEGGSATRIAVPYGDVVALSADLRAFIATYFGDLDYPADLFLAARTAIRTLASLQVSRRLFVSQRGLSAGDTDAPLAGTGRYVPYRLRRGDSLERVAVSFLGDASRWVEIAQANDLVYPFTETDRDYAQGYTTDFTGGYVITPFPDRTGVPDGVKVTGETIWLPPDARLPAPTSTTEKDVELYGRDMAVDPKGFFQFTADGEIVTVEGEPNMVQALGQRLRTMRGELLLHPEYGINRLLTVGVEGTFGNVQLAGLEMARTVVQDPRVTKVSNLADLFQNTALTVGMTARLIGPSDRDLPLNLVIPETLVGP